MLFVVLIACICMYVRACVRVFPAIHQMLEDMRVLRQENDRLRDEVRAMEVAKEEERSRVLMGQEAVARLEQEVCGVSCTDRCL